VPLDGPEHETRVCEAEAEDRGKDQRRTNERGSEEISTDSLEAERSKATTVRVLQ